MAGNERKPLAVMALSIPEPRFPCEGADFGSSRSSEIHNRRDDEHHPAGDLYYANVVDRETNTACEGFFCQPCIEAHGLKVGRKPSLAEVIREKAEAELRKAAEEIVSSMKIR